MTTPYKVNRRLAITIDPTAVCNDCRFERQSGPHTLQDVKDHAAATGHTIRMSQETLSVYEGVKR
jgi:hypothetical protein